MRLHLLLNLVNMYIIVSMYNILIFHIHTYIVANGSKSKDLQRASFVSWATRDD